LSCCCGQEISLLLVLLHVVLAIDPPLPSITITRARTRTTLSGAGCGHAGYGATGNIPANLPGAEGFRKFSYLSIARTWLSGKLRAIDPF